MKNSISKIVQFAGLFVMIFLLSSCNSIQPVLILTPGDFIILGIVDIFLSLGLALYISGAKSKWKFWFWFIVGIFLPVLTIIIAIVKSAFAEKKEDNNE